MEIDLGVVEVALSKAITSVNLMLRNETRGHWLPTAVSRCSVADLVAPFSSGLPG